MEAFSFEEHEFVPQENFMRRAIELALRGGGKVHPNPLVGAVIEKNGRIIAEGFHHEYGALHAERDALKNAREKNSDVSGAVLYVTLEPCCHTGKQPPCTQAVIDAGIKTVVIGSRDPNPLVKGKGGSQLEEAGIHVVRDFLKFECDALNEIFFHFITHRRPFVVAKYAQSADGKTSLSTGESKWITGQKSRDYVHYLRGTMAAVMCGIQTVLKDDPLLNCRIQGEGIKQPLRVVLDSDLKIPLESRLVKSAREFPLLVFTCSDSEKKSELEAMGVSVVKAGKKDSHIDLMDVLKKLGELSVDSVLVESGGFLNAGLFFYGAEKKCLVNKVLCFVAPKILGGVDGIVHSAVQGLECDSLASCVALSLKNVRAFSDDVLLEYSVEEKLCLQE
ncbi:bifunctional diaminohydroxyphosphoribosylaminopyrimidine deaminase/5-amino-6-(5-phosphoribosylamino)uracil reductase RibD [Treponema sp.]|uniref:bifunctional diaminohydroxyphosphoribosylaminopyrimidine deaminase/5-amino-6-(5-phosphoribosylamino)uracil reductase RibD n=1 Tax=Treponema sp. TaxID=166 RepID=UPI003F0BC17E